MASKRLKIVRRCVILLYAEQHAADDRKDPCAAVRIFSFFAPQKYTYGVYMLNTGRTAARETLFKLIYEYTVRGERDDFTLSVFCHGMTDDDTEYIKSAYNGILSRADELKGKIASLSDGFAIDRIYKVDLAILMVATYEILYRSDIPCPVSANEATKLAEKYSTDKSRAFVNGVIASVIKEKDNG